MLPIEKGCQAIIIGLPVSSGISVIVGCYLGEVHGYDWLDRWSVDKKLPMADGSTARHISEKYLMRIDGHKEETKQKEVELIK